MVHFVHFSSRDEKGSIFDHELMFINLTLIINLLTCVAKIFSKFLLGQLLPVKLKHWVNLSAKFSKRVSGPKNQHGKNSIIKRYFQKQPLSNQYLRFEQRTKKAHF